MQFGICNQAGLRGAHASADVRWIGSGRPSRAPTKSCWIRCGSSGPITGACSSPRWS